MRFFWMFFVVGSLFSTQTWSLDSPNKASVIENYRQRNYQIAKVGFDVLVQANPDDDESRYYLTLTYSQLGKAPEAVEAFRPLLEKNPYYYNYKVIFDPDLGPIRSDPAFQALLSQFPAIYLAQDKRSFDRIAQTPQGLMLYRNGMEYPLKKMEPGQIPLKTWAGFLEEDWLYYAWEKATVIPATKKKEPDTTQFESSLSLYSTYDKQEQSLYYGAEALSSIATTVLRGRTVFVWQAGPTLYASLLDKTLIPLITRQGRLINFDTLSGQIFYETPAPSPKESPSSQVISLHDVLDEKGIK